LKLKIVVDVIYNELPLLKEVIEQMLIEVKNNKK